MGKKNSGARAASSNQGSRRRKGGRGSINLKASHRERDRNTLESTDGVEWRPDSVVDGEEEERENQLSTGT